jgi:hypothetical protein
MISISTFLPRATYLLPIFALLATAVAGSVSIPLEALLNGTTLEFVVNEVDSRAGGKDTVTITYSIPHESWLSVGVNPTGFMAGGQGVIGFPDDGSVLKFNLTTVTPFPDEQQTLIDTSVLQSGDGTTTMTFTKILIEGGDEIPINIGSNVFLAAYGTDNNLGYHQARGSFELDLLAGEAAAIQLRAQNLWRAHGVFAALAWGLFAPMAIGASVLRKLFPDGTWFKLHQGLAGLVTIFTLVAFVLAVVAINKDGVGNHFDPQYPHRLVGLIVFILVIVQSMGGNFRPPTPQAGEKKTFARAFWEKGHRVIALALLAMALYQIHTGIMIMQYFFGAGQNLHAIFWGLFGGLLGLIMVGVVVTKHMDDEKGEEVDDNEAEEIIPPKV